MDPRISVIVRSYNRIGVLCELLEILLRQDHDSYEVVIVEQSDQYENRELEQLEKLAEDKRVTILKYPRLGGPKARNEGVRHAKGEILVFIDDDDLPVSRSWIKQHDEAYIDEKLVGFTGRHVSEENAKCPYLKVMRNFVRRNCMSYSFLGTPYTFAQFNETVKDVDWLHGTNSSIRKDWVLKAGFWDEDIKTQDEHSLAFKLQPHLKDGYRLDFKKAPELIRQLDIEGGMEKRNFSLLQEFKNQHQYITKVILRYRPFLILMYPFLFFWAIIKVGMQATKKVINYFLQNN